jgi:hypothetical protein
MNFTGNGFSYTELTFSLTRIMKNYIKIQYILLKNLLYTTLIK